MAVRRPCMERPEARQQAEAHHHEREQHLLRAGRQSAVLHRIAQAKYVERAYVHPDIDGDDGYPDEHARRDDHEHEFQRAVLLGPREVSERGAGTPHCDEEEHGNDGQFVEEEEEEQVYGRERSIHARDEDEQQDVVVLRVPVHVRGDHRAGERHDAREQDHRGRDAVDAQPEIYPHRLEPRVDLDELESVRARRVIEGDEHPGRAGHEQRAGPDADPSRDRPPGRRERHEHSRREHRQEDEPFQDVPLRETHPVTPRTTAVLQGPPRRRLCRPHSPRRGRSRDIAGAGLLPPRSDQGH